MMYLLAMKSRRLDLWILFLLLRCGWRAASCKYRASRFSELDVASVLGNPFWNLSI